MKAHLPHYRHSRAGGNPDPSFPGFRLAPAIASLAGMTVKVDHESMNRPKYFSPPRRERMKEGVHHSTSFPSPSGRVYPELVEGARVRVVTLKF